MTSNVRKFYDEIMSSRGIINRYYQRGGITITDEVYVQLSLGNGRWVKVMDKPFTLPTEIVLIDTVKHNTRGYAHGSNRETDIDMPWWMRWMICRKIRRGYVIQSRKEYLNASNERLNEFFGD